MLFAKILLITMMMAMYLASCTLLLADAFSLPWMSLLIGLHILYSWGVIWLYASLKVRHGGLWVNLLIPVLTTTSTLGIVIWMVFRPEVTRLIAS
jgi:hypothetical protein